jgi:hypothetical protein
MDLKQTAIKKRFQSMSAPLFLPAALAAWTSTLTLASAVTWLKTG